MPLRQAALTRQRRKGKRHNHSPGISGILCRLVGFAISENPYRSGLSRYPHQQSEISDLRTTSSLAWALPDRQATRIVSHLAIITPQSVTASARGAREADFPSSGPGKLGL